MWATVLLLWTLPAAAQAAVDGSWRLDQHRPAEEEREEDPVASGAARRLANEHLAEQVHLGLGGPGEVVVTFLAPKRGLASEVFHAKQGVMKPSRGIQGQVSTYSSYICPGNNERIRRPAVGPSPALPDEELAALVNTSSILPPSSFSYVHLDTAEQAWVALVAGCIDYVNPLSFYQSPYIHTVVLKDLQPRVSYHCRLGLHGVEFSFVAPPAAGDPVADSPLRLGVWSNVGVTNVSKGLVEAMQALQPDLLLLVGNFAFEDGWNHRWDIFGQLTEPLMSSVPTLGVPGNHEIAAGRTQGRDWMERYPVPFRESGSESPFWYSYESGLVHFLCLVGSYAPTDWDSPQYEFALQDLRRVNRERTPWLVVQFHTPWYSSNTRHYQAGYKHKQDMEDLFYIYGVDVIFNGHVNAYERSFPVHKDKVNRCGPVHIVVGSGGNYDGPALSWNPQPAWSAFRSASPGTGLLTVTNSTHAEWEWRRVACLRVSEATGYQPYYTWDGHAGPPGGPQCSTEGDQSPHHFETSDFTRLVRDVSACPSRLAGTGPGWPMRKTIAEGAAERYRRRLRETSEDQHDFTQKTPETIQTGSDSRAEVSRSSPFPPGPHAERPVEQAQQEQRAGGHLQQETRRVKGVPPGRVLTRNEALELNAASHAEARRLVEEDPVQQVHLGYGGVGEVTVTFATWVRGLSSDVLYNEGDALLPDEQASVAAGEVTTYTTLICPTGGSLHYPHMGQRTVVHDEELAKLVDTSSILPATSAAYKKLGFPSQAWDNLEQLCISYDNPQAYHQSPYIHTAVLSGLRPRTTYSYRPSNSSRTFSFTTPPVPGPVPAGAPLRIGIWADVGNTNISWRVMQQMRSFNAEFAILVGDYSYADGWSPGWDVFGTLHEPLMSSTATIGVPGNHELSEGRYQGIDWETRYPVPFRQSGSENPMWYSYESGPVHILGLVGSYAPSGLHSPQFHFAREDLERVDRVKTPWVIVLFHTPWYNSNTKHYQEGYKHQMDMEDLFHKYGVDFVFNGHVHSYERSHAAYKGKVNPCGTVHVVVGDAGNYEGPANSWREPQPEWSAIREATFGAGLLTVFNSTHAEWAWNRSVCIHRGADNGGHDWWSGTTQASCSTQDDNSAQRSVQSDVIMLVRDADACPNRLMPVREDGGGLLWWSWVLIIVSTAACLVGIGLLLVMAALKASRTKRELELGDPASDDSDEE